MRRHDFCIVLSVMFYKVQQKRLFVLLLGCWMLLGSVQVAQAIPTLQLDVGSSTTFYDLASESITTTSPNFTLYALLNPDKDSDLDGKYFISAAVLGPIDSGGSFKFGGQEIAVNSEMDFGTPPLSGDGKQLPPHGIFDTYYAEFAINFGEAFEAIPYNTQDDAGFGGNPFEGSGFYALAFDIDVSKLGEGLSLHFDLYQTGSGVVEFAPFSHNAQFQRAPEPGTILLLGLGLTGLATWHRRRRSAGQ
jgi:hypothetical protein